MVAAAVRCSVQAPCADSSEMFATAGYWLRGLQLDG